MRREREVTEDDLVRLTERIWLGDPSDDRVAVSSRPLGSQYTTVQRYAVLPTADAPRYLVPVGAWRGLITTAYHAPHPSWVVRAGRTALAGGAGARMAIPGVHHLYVGVRRDVPVSQWPDLLLLSRLSHELGRDVQALVPVRRERPTSKPTMRLFTADGTGVGFAKVGWSAHTNALVENETQVLRQLHGRIGRLGTPDVLTAGDVGGRRYLATESGRSPVRRNVFEASEVAALAHEVASSSDVTRARLDASPHLAQLHAELAALSASSQVACVRDLLSAVLTRRGDHVLPWGRWHGDWTSWNVATAAGLPYAWDWEFSAPDVPVGLDLVHWHFQGALARSGGTLVRALRAAEAARNHIRVLGLDDRDWLVLRACYLVEVLARACQLHAQGAGWNPRLVDGLDGVTREVRASL